MTKWDALIALIVLGAIGVATLLFFSRPGHAGEAVGGGVASVYWPNDGGQKGTGTASGHRLNPRELTAAHRSLPFGSKVEVTNRRNGRSVVVTITDRGPFVRGRVIDLTPAGAHGLGFSGLAPVTLRVLSRH